MITCFVLSHGLRISIQVFYNNQTGNILIDGHNFTDSMKKALNGYAEQQDILNPYMSVLETIEFTANCRLPHNVDKHAVVNQVIGAIVLGKFT